jgi:hypothetical protein
LSVARASARSTAATRPASAASSRAAADARGRATPGTQAGVESPAGRAGEAARRTAPLADNPAGPGRDRRSCDVRVPEQPSSVHEPLVGTLAHAGSGQARASSSRSADRCARGTRRASCASLSASRLLVGPMPLYRFAAKLQALPQFHTVRLSYSSVATWRHGTRLHRSVGPVGNPHPEVAAPRAEAALRDRGHVRDRLVMNALEEKLARSSGAPAKRRGTKV